MKKCKSDSGRFTRHRWLENEICERCKKTRNPKAGLKMFRPVKIKLDKFQKEEYKSSSTSVQVQDLRTGVYE